MLLWFMLALLFRWRFQYSIRSLLVLAVVVAIPCSWLATEMQRASKQKKAVEAIVKLEGEVTYDYELNASGKVVPGASPWVPAWLRNLLGADFFTAIVGVNISQPIVIDLGFPSPGCVHIDERDDPPIDADLEFLDGLTELRELYLNGSVVTDAGLEHLAGLSRLQFLDIQLTHVTDAGLENLKGLTQLQALFLDSNRVTDAGLRHVKGLRQLRKLSLSGTHVTDFGLELLKGLNQLQLLDLGSTKVTDAGLEHLAGLSQLQFLDLQRTQVTDAGLKDLPRRHPQLQKLSLFGSKVTDAGMSRFRLALPNCTLPPNHYEGMHGMGFF